VLIRVAQALSVPLTKVLGEALENDTRQCTDGSPDGLTIANSAAERRGLNSDQLRERVEQLEAALAEALDIAEWEASEYQGKPEHLERLPQLRSLLRKGNG
jgi:hypothetical protein